MAMYSPSAYAIGGAGGVGAAKSEGGGVFGMLMSARAEVEEEKDAQLVRLCPVPDTSPAGQLLLI